MMKVMESMGSQIRVMRKERNWTLEEFSRRSGLSIGFLSQVERGLSSLSISSLSAICEALSVPMSTFLVAEHSAPMVVKGGCGATQIRFPGSGVTYDMLSGATPTRQLEVLIAAYPPGSEPPMITHEGEEFGYILEGRLILTVEDVSYELEKGDSFHFLSALRHTIRNPYDVPARTLWVQTQRMLGGGRQVR